MAWIDLNATNPAAPAGAQNVHFRKDAEHLGTEADPYPVSAYIAPFTGDSGSGGASGLVPAPAAGDAAAGKVLKADGTWYAQPGFANPMTTEGDLIVGGASGAPARLAAGTSGYVLTSNGAGSKPGWQIASTGSGSGSSGSSGSPSDPCQNIDFTAASGVIAQDSSIFANHAWLSSGCTAGSDGVTTDGSAAYIDTGMCLLGRYAFSVAVRFKTTQVSAGSQYWSHPCLFGVSLNTNGGDFSMYVENGYFGVFNGMNSSSDSYKTSSVQVADGAWHIVVMCINGSSIKSYVDGASAAIDLADGTITTPALARYRNSNCLEGVWMGRLNTLDSDTSTYGSTLAATFARLRVWRYALSSDEVSALSL